MFRSISSLCTRRGNRLILSGKEKAALKWFNLAIAVSPRTADAWMLKMSALLRLGREKEAHLLLQRIAKRFPALMALFERNGLVSRVKEGEET